MKKLILVVLEDSKQAFDLFFKVKSHTYVPKDYLVLEGAVFHKENDKFHYQDGFAQKHDGLRFLDDGLLFNFSRLIAIPYTNDAGGLFAMGRPLIQRNLKQDLDFEYDIDTKSFFQVFHEKIQEGQYGVVLHVSELDERKLDKLFEDFCPEHVYRADAIDTYYALSLRDEYNNHFIASNLKDGGITHFHEVSKNAEQIEENAKKNAEKISAEVQEKMDALIEHHENSAK